MDGFGASDAWRCQMVGKYWPLGKRNAIADLLFSKEVDANGNPRGIGLSIWRFYLGAGSYEQGEASDIADEWRRAECFQNQMEHTIGQSRKGSVGFCKLQNSAELKSFCFHN